jgi:Na+-transporting NADH:ubiquinone oxidoreductase subunit A
MIHISKGLNLPIAGTPSQSIAAGPLVNRVALIADDYIGMKPTMAVEVGDKVKLGQLLFTDKKTAGVRYTSPGCGTVEAINRAAKRKFQSIVIALDGDDQETFESYEDVDLTTLTSQQVRDNLINSGLWSALRTRPFSMVPAIDAVPHSIFVTAIDTRPLAADPQVVLASARIPFTNGLHVLKHLTEGELHLCTAPGSLIPGRDVDFVNLAEFSGPHPAGLPGTHIHFLDPVSANKSVWTIDYQDVIAIGKLFATGQLSVERVISLAGPMVRIPRLITTRVGASLDDLTKNQLNPGDVRVISGSVLYGRALEAPKDFLGRYHLQVSALAEGPEREFLGWMGPGLNKFSIKKVFASAMFGNSRAKAFTTSTEGSPRAMVPIGMYEHVMPLDILPTFLLRSLIVDDSEQAQALGCLELDEEDLSLCTFVCPGKMDYGPILRRNLTTIEQEG